MSPGNDQRRPGRGSGVEKVTQQQTNHRVSRPTDNARSPRVRGVVTIDLTDLEPWAHWHDELHEAKMRVWGSVVGIPAGADVVLRPGRINPMPDMFGEPEAFRRLGTFTVECDDANTIKRWTEALREVLA